MLFSRVGWSFTCCIERSADMWRKALLMVLGTWFPVTSFIFQFISGKLKSTPSRKMWFMFLLLRFCISVMVLSTYLMSCLLGGL